MFLKSSGIIIAAPNIPTAQMMEPVNSCQKVKPNPSNTAIGKNKNAIISFLEVKRKFSPPKIWANKNHPRKAVLKAVQIFAIIQIVFIIKLLINYNNH